MRILCDGQAFYATVKIQLYKNGTEVSTQTHKKPTESVTFVCSRFLFPSSLFFMDIPSVLLFFYTGLLMALFLDRLQSKHDHSVPFRWGTVRWHHRGVAVRERH